MLATMSQQAPTMSLPTSHQSAPKRPRLSLQIKSSPLTMSVNPGAAVKADIDPTSVTAFNTLSNAYAAAIELSSPKVASPRVGFDSKKPANKIGKSGLRLVTSADSNKTPIFPSQHTQTPGSFNFTYPDTPSAAFSAISPITAHPDLRLNIPSFTFTPPQSAHPSDESTAKVFSFSSRLADTASPISPRTPRRRATTGNQNLTAPYTHPRTLRSILRNSPLPPRSSLAPPSPSRSSRRQADRAGKKLCFNNPLTQTITTERYIKSHIDLLVEEASPRSATDSEAEGSETLDLAMAYTGDETRDGGQTPGPFEEMRRRMAGLGNDSDSETPGTKKRKRKEKKRRWVWTIGVNEEELGDDGQSPVSLSRSESPETLGQAQTAANDLQSKNVYQTPVTEISPSKTMNEMTALVAQNLSEVMGETPLTKIRLPSGSTDKTHPTAIQLRPDVFKYNLTAAQIEGLPEPQASVTFIDCNGDTEMIDRPGTSHSI